MTDNENPIPALRERVSIAQARRARAQAEYDRAERDRATAMKTLKDEFDVETTEEAAALLKTLESDLATALAEVETALEAAEA